MVKNKNVLFLYKRLPVLMFHNVLHSHARLVALLNIPLIIGKHTVCGDIFLNQLINMEYCIHHRETV